MRPAAQLQRTPMLLVHTMSTSPGSSSRLRHTGYGALTGAVLGGVLGLVHDRLDHTGEGFIWQFEVGAGAVAGATVGALVGLVLPTHRESTN